MVDLTPVGPRIRRRFQLRFDLPLAERLESCAMRSGVSVAALVQTVLDDVFSKDGLTLSTILRRSEGSDLPAVACLWAAEEVLRYLSDGFPHLRRQPGSRADSLAKAEDRLDELRQILDGGGR